MRTRERDAALQRLRRLTVVAGAGAGALVAAFAGLAARAVPGRHAVTTSGLGHVRAVAQPRAVDATPPPLVPVAPAGAAQPQAPATAPAPPPAPPVVPASPPVVVSGGS